jgi:hypothetical protein
MKIKMKKLAVLTIVVTLIAISMLTISVIPALAAGGPPADRGTASGNCTGDQAGLGTGNQVGFGTSYQAGMGNIYQNGFGVRTPFALSGTIIALDANASTVTVEVSCGNGLVKEYIGTDVTLETLGITRILLSNDDGSATPINFDQLEVGQTVSSHGTLSDGVFTSVRITVGAVLDCLP